MLKPLKDLEMRIRLPLLLATVLLVGCVDRKPLKLPTAFVKGTVLLDGLPVDQAKIIFVPTNLRNADEEIMQLAYGVTDVDGSFELANSDGTKELLIGSYNVLISKDVSNPGGQGAENEPWRKSLLPDSVANLIAFEENENPFPPIYNRDSKLTFELNGAARVARPQFELTSSESQHNEESASDSR